MRVIDLAMLLALVVLILFWVELELNSLYRRFSAKPDRLDSLSADRYRGIRSLSEAQLRCLATDFQQASLAAQVLIAKSPRERCRLGCWLVVYQIFFLGTLWMVRCGLRADHARMVKCYDQLLSRAKAVSTRGTR